MLSVNTITRKRAFDLEFFIASKNVPITPVRSWYFKSSESAFISHPNSSFAKREYAPGQHGQRRKKQTDYGAQLYAKQSLKTVYGIFPQQH